MRLTFQNKHRSSQSSFVDAAGAGCGKCILITASAANLLAGFVWYNSDGWQTTLPTDNFPAREELSLLPATRTGDAQRARLDTCAADNTGPWVHQRQQRVVAKVGRAIKEHCNVTQKHFLPRIFAAEPELENERKKLDIRKPEESAPAEPAIRFLSAFISG
jgi:hypothetical protein